MRPALACPFVGSCVGLYQVVPRQPPPEPVQVRVYTPAAFVMMKVLVDSEVEVTT